MALGGFNSPPGGVPNTAGSLPTVRGFPNTLFNKDIAATTVGIPLYSGAGTATPRRVYYQSLFVPLYVAAAVVAATPSSSWSAPLSVAAPVAKVSRDFGSVPFSSPAVVTVDKWQQPLSIALPPAKPQAGSSSVPFNTAQLSVNFTNFGWHGPTATAPPVAKAQVGNSFVPFNTAQLSVNFTNFGWHGPLAGAPAVARAMPGWRDVPYNTAQLSVNFTNFGWHGPTSTAPPVAKARQGDSYVPYNTAQVIVAAAYTNFWLQPLSVAVPVAKAVQGDAFVPLNTLQTVWTGIPIDTGGPAATVRKTYYQSRFQPLYVAPTPDTTVGIPFDIGGVAPSYRTVFHQSLFEAPYQLPPAVQGWWSPLSVAIPPAKAQVGFSFVPFDTVQVAPTVHCGIPIDTGGAAPRLRQVYYQANFVAPYVAPVAVAGIAGIAWFSPLGIIPARTLAAQGNSFVPFDTVQRGPAGIAGIAWFSPLGMIPARTPVARPGNSFVPFNTVQTIVTATARRKPLLFISNVGRLMN